MVEGVTKFTRLEMLKEMHGRWQADEERDALEDDGTRSAAASASRSPSRRTCASSCSPCRRTSA